MINPSKRCVNPREEKGTELHNKGAAPKLWVRVRGLVIVKSLSHDCIFFFP